MPFTTAQFFGVFREYNEAFWPFQLVALALVFAPRRRVATGSVWGR